MEIICFCPTCGSGNRLAKPLPAGPECRSCRAPLPMAPPASQAAPSADSGGLRRCPVCGEDKLYVQKRFRQKLGCLIIAAGAAAVPWTYGLSLAACALFDLILYRMLPTIAVCYVCATRIAGTRLDPELAPYDLMTAQTWEARSVTWRRRHDRSAGPQC